MRVFVSSTFRDMQAERDALAKRVFPLLRAACESRGVAWGEVDLRWGITDEDAAEGRVLPICLAEIDVCRPFFIGILGERYGYVPATLDSALLESLPWIGAMAGASVTEIEIFHGVLNAPASAGRALFYFRAPDVDPGPQDKAARARLSALKARIRASGSSVREDFSDCDALAELVHADLMAALDSAYPVAEAPSPEDAEALAGHRFAAARGANFAGRESLVSTIESAISRGGVHVIAGDAGTGKSALLAHVVERARSPPPLEALPSAALASVRRRSLGARREGERALPSGAVHVIDHWVGSAPRTEELAAMLRGLVLRLQRTFNLSGEVPDKVEQLANCFVDFLGMAARRGRVTVIIDGVDRLVDRDGGPDLLWLPRETPPGVTILLSSRRGRTLDAACDRGVEVTELLPLSVAERRKIATAFLSHFRKVLGPTRMERLIGAPGAGNPGFLRAVLERLRVFGHHEELDNAIAHWGSATNLPELQMLVLAELEADHGRALAQDLFGLLAASRHGLTEAELRDLLVDGGTPMATLSPLLLGAAGLVERVGAKLALVDDTLREVVLDRVASDNILRLALHRRLADYLATRDEARQAEERLWQLERAGDHASLVAALASPQLLGALDAAGRLDEALGAWRAAEEVEAGRMPETYRATIDQPWEAPDHALRVGRLLLARGYTADARELLDWLAKADEFGLHDVRRETLTRLQLAHSAADVVSATLQLAKAAALARNAGEPLLEGGTAMEFGNLFLEAGAAKEAAPHFRKAATLFEAVGATLNHGLALNNLGIAQERAGKRKTALRTYRQAEVMLERAGAITGVARAVDHQGGTLYKLGDTEGAIEAWARAQRLFRQSGDDSGLLVSLSNMAFLVVLGTEPERAVPLLANAEKIADRLPPCDGTARVAENLFLLCMRPDLANRPSFDGLDLMQLGFGSLARARELRQRVGGVDKLRSVLMLAAEMRRNAEDELGALLIEAQLSSLDDGDAPAAPPAKGIRKDETYLPTQGYVAALHRSDADWVAQIDRARCLGPTDLMHELTWWGHGLRGQRRCEEAIAVYEQLGAAARACGDVETVYRSYKERSIASAMAGDAAGAARHALAQLDYATVLGEPARISQAVDLCHERDMGRVLSPHPGELATLVGRVRAIAPPAMRIEAAIALAAASFLGRGDRQGLLDEAAQTAQSAGMTQRASAALAARAALPP